MSRKNYRKSQTRVKDSQISGKKSIQPQQQQEKISALSENWETFYKNKSNKMFEATNVDGIMIGRAAIGNPWIFEEIINYLEGKPQREVSNKERLEVIKEHIELEVKEKGEDTGIKEMRKHVSAYIKNQKDATKIRNEINTIQTQKALEECLTQYFEQI